MGKVLEDCRLYVGGGCQENVLENTEINSRATIYLNLLKVFLMGFCPPKNGRSLPNAKEPGLNHTKHATRSKRSTKPTCGISKWLWMRTLINAIFLKRRVGVSALVPCILR